MELTTSSFQFTYPKTTVSLAIFTIFTMFKPRPFKFLQSINIRVGIVIILITISADAIHQFIVGSILYQNIIGNSPEEALGYSFQFLLHKDLELATQNMPEDIRQIFLTIRNSVERNANRAAIYLKFRFWIVLSALALIIPILLIISVTINRRVTSPIRSLISATRNLTQGDLTTRAQPKPRYWDNYSLALANDFNSMAHSLESLEKERQTMIADIAHELRTPITTMQLRLEAVKDGIDPLNLDLIDSLHSETELLSGLIVDLRTLSLAEAKQLSLNRQSFDLNNFFNSIAQRFTPSAQKKNISITIEGNKDTFIFADAERLNQILNNLMSNAIRHTPEGGEIKLKYESNTEGVTLQVINTGSALPPEELSHLFNRFYRSGQGRIRAEGGSGLGLAIVKALTELHGGTVGVKNYQDDSIMFYLSLPQNYS